MIMWGLAVAGQWGCCVKYVLQDRRQASGVGVMEFPSSICLRPTKSKKSCSLAPCVRFVR